jgi:YVTN family beta-propeller protein
MGKFTLIVLSALFSCSAAAAPFAYITNQGADTVSVVDLGLDKVVATIATGKAPVGVAIDHGKNRLYVTNVEGRSVSIIDLLTNKPIGEIKLAISPVGIVLSKDASQLFVADWFEDHILVFDTKKVLDAD